MKGKYHSHWLEKIMMSSGSKKGLFLRCFLGTILVGLIGIMALVIVVFASPRTGAQGADLLRNILGPKPVANLEAIVYTIQDTVHQLTYKLERATPSTPWEASTTPGAASKNANKLSSADQSPATSTPAPGGNNAYQPIFINLPQGATPAAPAVTLAPVPTPWTLANLPPLGASSGEGIWTSYIPDPSGNPLAYRTFIQPDPKRPYVFVAIVAFDLTHTNLHYQLGTVDPVVPGRAPGTGQIPSTDLQPGTLLAAFNGAFKTINGHFGVMLDGNVLIPMIDKMGTLAIYKDGSIRIGEWGVDLTYTPDMVVARQNCPLIVQNGQINPLVYNNSVNDWGGTISGNIVTFRSGIGISQDGRTLYYFAGNYLTMPVLARAMQDAGAYQAMQLDINNYYVHFTKFEFQNNKFVGVPLLPKEMVDNVDRFLGSYSRDFFYVTANNP